MVDVAHAGRVALSAGLMVWARGIQDPTRKAWSDPAFASDRRFIDQIIRTPLGLDWRRCSTFTAEYRWDGDFEWCGAFAAYCWGQAGLSLDVRRRYWSSTYRLDRYGRHKRAFAEAVPVVDPPHRRRHLAIDGDAHEVDEWGPRAGDVLIVHGRSYGQHITIVERWDPVACVFETVEGNATGRGPKGERFQGVVRQTRPLSVCRRLIRPGLCDLEV